MTRKIPAWSKFFDGLDSFSLQRLTLEFRVYIGVIYSSLNS